jgi:Lipid A 3-O-deacylase (PagL)
MKFYLCLAAMGLSGHLLAQPLPIDSTARPVRVGLRAHHGFIIPHSEDIRELARSRPWGAELEVSRQLTARRHWQYCQCFPQMGLSVMYVNFDNREILGSSLAAVAFVEPVLAAHRRFHVAFRTGAGLAYLNRVYHPQTNPRNLFYSTPVSFVLLMGAEASFGLGPHYRLRAFGSFNHISNGGLQEPNKGINYPTVGLGLAYTARPVGLPSFQKADWRQGLARRTHWYAAAFATAKTAERGDPARFAILGATVGVARVVGRLSALTAGLEGAVDLALREQMSRQNSPAPHHWAAGLVGHQLLLGRFRFTQQLGAYFYRPAPALQPVYQRYGLEFQATKRFWLGLNLKAHTYTADFMDLRLGWQR